MNADIIKEWGGAMAVFLSTGGIIYAWLTRRSKENTETIAKMGAELSSRLKVIEKKLVTDDRRIQSLESDLKHLPDHEDFTQLRIAIAELSGMVTSTQTTVAGINATVKRLEQNFIDTKKG